MGWEEGSKRARNVPLREVFNNPKLLFQGELDNLVRGMVMSPMMTMDRVVTSEVTNHLFQEKNKRSGMDLAALNIQRGRDHGLAGYNAYRAVCGLPPASNFDDLLPHVPISQVSLLEKVGYWLIHFTICRLEEWQICMRHPTTLIYSRG